MDPTHPDFYGWPNDSDLEPNSTPSLAVVFPCGSDEVVTNPTLYRQMCPSRDNYTNGFMNLLICPAGERDLYSIYLLAGESVYFNLLYLYQPSTWQMDIDLTVWHWDDQMQQLVEIATADTVSNNDTLSITATDEGWYYADVHGKTTADINYYTISFTLNPGP